MDTSPAETETEKCGARVASVSKSILAHFLDELAKDESVSDSVPRLRQIILDDGVFSEAAIRSALFPDAT